MKLLLIGFSTQSAGVLAMLINRNYPDCEVQTIERVFCENLRLCLPTLEQKHQDTAAMVINLDGVGMISMNAKHVKNLQNFIGARPAILVAKAYLDEWRAAKILPERFAFFVRSPYDKQTMTEALDGLLTIAPTAKAHIKEFHQNDLSPQMIIDQEVRPPVAPETQRPREHFLHKLLDEHFAGAENELLHEMLEVTLSHCPVKIIAGSQVIYANPAKNMALIGNMERLLDYCGVVNNFKAYNSALLIESITEDVFQELLNSSSYQKYALSTLLWQLYGAILPAHIEGEHTLLLKMRYMPNFAVMGSVPDYVRTAVSACLVLPRTLAGLYETFEPKVPKPLLNRVFLLAILSGVADVQVLQRSLSSDERTHNVGVQKAQKSGFLNRLLQVLNKKVI